MPTFHDDWTTAVVALPAHSGLRDYPFADENGLIPLNALAPSVAGTLERFATDSRCRCMVQAKEMTARADELISLAEKMHDVSLARSLRQRARYWHAMALEIAVFESDPLYRRIHDGPAAHSKSEPASVA